MVFLLPNSIRTFFSDKNFKNIECFNTLTPKKHHPCTQEKFSEGPQISISPIHQPHVNIDHGFTLITWCSAHAHDKIYILEYTLLQNQFYNYYVRSLMCSRGGQSSQYTTRCAASPWWCLKTISYFQLVFEGTNCKYDGIQKKSHDL